MYIYHKIISCTNQYYVKCNQSALLSCCAYMYHNNISIFPNHLRARRGLEAINIITDTKRNEA